MSDNIFLLKYDILQDVTHCFTTRTGGVSTGGQTSLNLSFSREKSAENVRENYKRTADVLGVDYHKLTRVPQKHTDRVLKITNDLVGIGISKNFTDDLLSSGYDAMITNVKGAVLCTSHADCVPILLYDSENNAVAAIHSGWRGTAKKICMRTVKLMHTEYSTKPALLKAVIGPSIGVDNFETDIDVIDAYKEAFKDKYEEYASKYVYCKVNNCGVNKFHVSVSGFVYETLIEAGLTPENIFRDDRCTFENKELFFSHRRDKGDTGVMAAMISVK